MTLAVYLKGRCGQCWAYLSLTLPFQAKLFDHFVSDISSASSPNVSFSLQMTLEFTSNLRRYPKVDRYDSLCWCKITKKEEFRRIPLYHRLSPCHQNGWMSSWKRITRRSPSDLAHQAALLQTRKHVGLQVQDYGVGQVINVINLIRIYILTRFDKL